MGVPKRNCFDWTEGRIQYLRDWWGKPSVSATMIAERLGTTKSSLIGKAHRIGLPNLGNPMGQRRAKPEPTPREPYERRKPGPKRTVDRERIAELFGDGFTDAQIGKHVGCVKEYVARLRREQGLMVRTFSAASTRRAIAKAADRQFSLPIEAPGSVPVALTTRNELTPVNSGSGVPMIDLDPRGCRFPTGERARGHLFCNAPNDRCSVYCEDHHAQAIGRGTASERAAMEGVAA